MAYITEDDPAAAELLAAVDELASDDHFFRARGAMWRAALASDSGAHDDAERLAAEAREEAAALTSVRVRGLAWSISGYVALAAGDAALALACAEERLRLEAPDSAGGANATIELAYALLTQGRIEEAAEQARAALGRAQRLGFPQVRGEAYRCMAWAALLLGDHTTAAGCLLEQLATFDGNDAMNDRVMDLPFTTALAVGLAGWVDEARALWAAGVGLIGRGDPPDFPLNLVALATRMGLEGGEPFPGDLRAVLHQASTLLVRLLPGGWDAAV